MSIKNKELAAVVEGDGRNWRGIGIAFLVILVICGIIAIAVFLLSPEIINLKKRTKKDEIDLNDFINGGFYPRLFNGSWYTNDSLIYKDEDDNLVIWNIYQNVSTRKIFVPASLFHVQNIQDFSLSADRQFLLVKQEVQKIFRHTYTAKFKIYRIQDEELFPLSPNLKQPDARLQYAAWGPKNSDLIFVYNNNLYYQQSVDGPSVQLTFDGNESIIYNGIPDWLYEEEVLSDSNAIYWSPEGQRVAFIRFDDSAVDTIGLTFYNDFLPKIYGLRYPRVARRNPRVNIFMVELATGQFEKVEIIPPIEITSSGDYYITDVTWINRTSVSVTWSRRLQDYSVISICSDTFKWKCLSINIVDSRGYGWNELKSPIFDETGQNYFLIIPSFQDKVYGSYHHIGKYNVNKPNATFITKGLFEVTNLVKYNRNLLYYQATLPGKQGERHQFHVNVDTYEVTCLSCDLKGHTRGSNSKERLKSTKDSQPNDCLYSRAFYNEDASVYILSCLGPGIPRTELRKTKTNEIVTILQANDALREKVDELLLPKEKLLQVPIEGGYNASVKLLLPPGLREDEIIKYPLVINVYGGPGTQQVTQRFDIGWGHYLSSRRRIIYGMIDGRGSGNNGVNLLREIYKRLGTVEIDDQIAVTRYLVNNLPYIDAKRVGIWGWSYGGYATTMALASEPTSSGHSDPVFSCGIAVAPVTSWFFYDSTYTERYMGLPNDNPDGYTKSDLITKIDNLKGKNYLLVHGTADDNVHLQQSMLLMRALQRNSIMFHSMIYPDQNHELPQVHRHLYRTIESFLCECFDLGTVYEEVGLRRRRIIKKEYS